MATAKTLKPKETLENSIVLIVSGSILSGFAGGIGVMSFLEHRDKETHDAIIAELQQKNTKLSTDNATLQVSNDQLDKAVRDALFRIVVQQNDVLGGPNSEVKQLSPDVLKDRIKTLPRRDIDQIIKDPTNNLHRIFGF